MRKNICNIVPCQDAFNFQFTDLYRNISLKVLDSHIYKKKNALDFITMH